MNCSIKFQIRKIQKQNKEFIYLFQCVLVFLYKAGNIIGKITVAFSVNKLIIYSLFQ